MIRSRHPQKHLTLALALSLGLPAALQAQTVLDPAWRVGAVNTAKPGFLWNYFQAPPNRGNTTERTESDLAGQSTDSSGALLANIGDPNQVGAAIGPAADANPTNALLRFEIDGVINLSKTDGGAGGYFPEDKLEPGVNFDPSTDGQSAEILTYLTLPAGETRMGVRSDDGFKCESGPNPLDVFGRAVVGERVGGAGELTFTVVVQQAGTYPFRLIWENGGGDSHIEWYTIKADDTKVLVNDLANGGIPAHRALASTAASVPYIKNVTPQPVPRQLEKTSRSVVITLADGAKAVDDASVALSIDGKSTPLTKRRQGASLTVDTGVPDGLRLPGEAHTAQLTFKEAGGSTVRTQSWSFYNLENLVLPATPVAKENFDSYPEATSEATTVPPGWVATNYTYRETEGWDLSDLTSDAYMNWVLITTDTVFAVEDEVLDNDKSQLVNGQPVANWMSGNLIFVASDGRKRNIPDPNGGPNISVGQIQFVTSAPFNLSTAANPVLTFSSGARLSGNKEQMTAEYSIDKGATWLPVIYMRNSTTVRLRPDGSFDAVAMCTETDLDQITRWPTPGVGPKGGNFGDMIAAPISQDLAPYFANRNDGVSARRVEAIRLPKASKQSDVRLRFTHAGSCGWEWGIDNIAFYDVPPPVSAEPKITQVAVAAGAISIQWTDGGTLESSPALANPVWTSTGNSSGSFTEPVAAAGAKFYRVKR